MVWKYKHICVYVRIFQVFIVHIFAQKSLCSLCVSSWHFQNWICHVCTGTLVGLQPKISVALSFDCCSVCRLANQTLWNLHSVHHLSMHLCVQLVNSVSWLAAFIIKVLWAACKCYFYCFRELSQFYDKYLNHSGAFVFDCILICVSNVLSAPNDLHEGALL